MSRAHAKKRQTQQFAHVFCGPFRVSIIFRIFNQPYLEFNTFRVYGLGLHQWIVG